MQTPGNSHPAKHTQRGRKKALVRKIENLLRKKYGQPSRNRPADPIDVLVQTILSQNTTDVNSHRAFKRLKECFDSWDAVRLAIPRRIENAIRSGGLAKTKALRISQILSQLHENRGSVSLEWLRDMEPYEAAKVLGEFKGVGPKTINCVLLFGCGMEAFPVDTHILRISKRLGLIPENTSMERAHKLWADFLPEKLAFPLHLNLITHGREICVARAPRCPACPLQRLCAYPPNTTLRPQQLPVL